MSNPVALVAAVLLSLLGVAALAVFVPRLKRRIRRRDVKVTLQIASDAQQFRRGLADARAAAARLAWVDQVRPDETIVDGDLVTALRPYLTDPSSPGALPSAVQLRAVRARRERRPL